MITMQGKPIPVHAIGDDCSGGHRSDAERAIRDMNLRGQQLWRYQQGLVAERDTYKREYETFRDEVEELHRICTSAEGLLNLHEDVCAPCNLDHITELKRMLSNDTVRAAHIGLAKKKLKELSERRENGSKRRRNK